MFPMPQANKPVSKRATKRAATLPRISRPESAQPEPSETRTSIVPTVPTGRYPLPVRHPSKGWHPLRVFLYRHWQPGQTAIDLTGAAVQPFNKDASGFSIGGAVQKVMPFRVAYDAMSVITATCAVLYDRCVQTWEDEPGRTWFDVIHLLRVAEWLGQSGLLRDAELFCVRDDLTSLSALDRTRMMQSAEHIRTVANRLRAQ